MTDIGATFRALHIKGDPLLMVNVWDGGSAKMMAAMGAKALATSSAAHAFTLGRPDGGTLTRDEALAHAQDIVSATPLPVQGDFENGFGDDPDTCAETVRMAAEIGLAGICIEDTALPDQTAYDFDLAVERIAAAAAAARGLGHDFVLTARADGILTGAYDTDEAIRRLLAFEAAGADCLYAPLPPDMAALARICAATQQRRSTRWLRGLSTATAKRISQRLGSRACRLALRSRGSPTAQFMMPQPPCSDRVIFPRFKKASAAISLTIC